MGFSLKKAFNAVAAPVKQVVQAVNPVTQVERLGKIAGVDTTGIADSLSGGAASKFKNVSNTVPDILSGNSVRDNLGDAVTLFQQGQGAAMGLVNPNGSFNFQEIFSQAKELANRKSGGQLPNDPQYYYSTPNINSGMGGMNPYLLYGGIGALLLVLLMRRK